MIDRPNYYAVLPASVRYDQRLRPNAKLLYAEITSLCNANGCCTAQNDYFSELYGVSKKTITELVGQLSASGYIKVEVIRDEKGQVLGRNIFLPAEDTEAADPPPKNRVYIKGEYYKKE
ncbi:helix-turn-helix domain-containing protein [Clostridiaceae bacterium]|nr:helix-turn-helix domain-containing protein [Clostridiaceae bacterium]